MRRVAALLFLLLTPVRFLHGQSTNASLTGRITDPAMALVVDARITAISETMNVRYETTTNGSGEYRFSNLPPGTYHLEIEKPGFKKLLKPHVILHVQDIVRVDFELTVGELSEAVSVKAGAPVLNTESATVSTVVDRSFVENVPLNGRSFQTLIALTPGVVLTTTSQNDQGRWSQCQLRRHGCANPRANCRRGVTRIQRFRRA